MTAVRKEVDREPDPGKKVELMKKKLGWFSRGQYWPVISDRSFRMVILDGHLNWKP